MFRALCIASYRQYYSFDDDDYDDDDDEDVASVWLLLPIPFERSFLTWITVVFASTDIGKGHASHG